MGRGRKRGERKIDLKRTTLDCVPLASLGCASNLPQATCMNPSKNRKAIEIKNILETSVNVVSWRPLFTCYHLLTIHKHMWLIQPGSSVRKQSFKWPLSPVTVHSASVACYIRLRLSGRGHQALHPLSGTWEKCPHVTVSPLCLLSLLKLPPGKKGANVVADRPMEKSVTTYMQRSLNLTGVQKKLSHSLSSSTHIIFFYL